MALSRASPAATGMYWTTWHRYQRLFADFLRERLRKAHISSIYGKMDEDNRVQAISRGKELGLL